MIRSSQHRAGFIRNPWSEQNDAIHINAFFHRISKEAGRRSGCHYEIYEKIRLDSFLEALESLEALNKKDAEHVRSLAKYSGLDLSQEGQQRTEKAFNHTMQLIQREQE